MRGAVPSRIVTFKDKKLVFAEWRWSRKRQRWYEIIDYGDFAAGKGGGQMKMKYNL